MIRRQIPATGARWPEPPEAVELEDWQIQQAKDEADGYLHDWEIKNYVIERILFFNDFPMDTDQCFRDYFAELKAEKWEEFYQAEISRLEANYAR